MSVPASAARFLRIIRVLLDPVIWWIAVLLKAVQWLGRHLLGVTWETPAWAAWSGRHAAAAGAWGRAHPSRAALTLALVAALGWSGHAGWRWYEARPKPVEVTMSVTPPPRTKVEEPGAKPAPVRIAFSHSVAPLNMAGKPVAAAIGLSPALEGSWQWEGDRALLFTPRVDWPLGTAFTVTFPTRGLFRPEARFATHVAQFGSAPFSVAITRAEFYQDPIDPAGKKVIATLTFSHPVDTRDVAAHVHLQMATAKAGVMTPEGGATPFKLTFDKQRLNAYVHSDVLPIPKESGSLALRVTPGIRSTLPGAAAREGGEKAVAIPGLASLGISEIAPTLVTNARFEPEQVVVVRTSALVHEREMNQALHAWVLPRDHPDSKEEDRRKPYAWSAADIERIGPEILKRSDDAAILPVAAEREVVDAFSYRYRAEPGRYVYVRVARGLSSFGGYQLGREHGEVFQVPPFPAEVKLMAQGALLALSGERKTTVLARDVAGLRYDLGRVLPAQLHQLVAFGLREGTQFQQPDFQGFDPNYLVERFTRDIRLPKASPGKPQYQALDFGEYLDQGGGGRKGVFLLRVRGLDPEKNREQGPEDRRLIVVTDLGLLAKRAVDGSHDVFVQSIHNGEPVARAQVEVIGRNGLPVLSETTDAQGHVRLPSFKGFDREREPVLLLARKDGDTSFLPYNRSDRRLDFSRFDIGGVANNIDSGQLSAYLFSDRGIYRPGEEIRLGMIVKAADWSRPLAGVPLELEVLDPRGLAVRRDTLRLSKGGLEEVRHATPDTAPTGTYTVNLYLPRDGTTPALVGATTVRVQEFQPDRLRMTTRFSAESAAGWVSPQELKARVSLQNLFGTAAENRRVTGTLTLTPSLPQFPSWPDFHFSDPQRAREGVSESLGEVRTNEQGEAEFDLKLQRFANATYRAHVLAQGFEADGGRGVSAEAAVMVSNLPYLVGYKADGDLGFVRRDARRSVELVAVNNTLKAVAVEGLTLIRVEQRFVSVLTRQPSGVYKYESKEKEIALDQKPLVLAAQGLTLPLETAAPGSYAYVLRDRDGLEFARIRYNVAGEANLARALDKNAELKLTLARADVAPGEELEIQIEAPYAGAGLIAIERERVHAFKWFKTTTTSTVQKITLPTGIEGNAYITVTFVRDPGSEEIFMSPLSYGVVPFSVSLAQRRVKLDLHVPERVKPGEILRIDAGSSAPVRAVVFAVDEGILQVARYRTADPLGYFFQKRALEVRTSQILDMILPELARVMAAAPGGDAENALGKFLNPFKRRHDAPVAWWSGVVELGPGVRALEWKVPEHFNGSLRVMAVAVNDSGLGVAEQKTTVRGDFVISPNLPLAVSPGDEFTVSAGIANSVADSGKDARVEVTLASTPQFEVVGEARQQLPIGALREGVAHFRLRARPAPGSGRLTFRAAIGARSATLSGDISVRPAVPFSHELAVGVLPGGQTDVPLTRRMYAAHRTLEASISHLPLGLSHGLASYLGEFPYSCTEQLVSMGLPALLLGNRPEFGHVRAKPGSDLPALLGVLRTRQNADGAYGLWAANAYVVEPVSVYAQQFLIEAAERGLKVPQDMLDRGNHHLEQLAGGEGETLADDRTRAHALYLLTRQGRMTGGLAAALQKRLEERDGKSWRTDITAVYLAASYQLLKQERLAERALEDFRLGALPARSGDVMAEQDADAYYDTLVKDAVGLHLMARHFPARVKSLTPEAYAAMIVPLQRGRYNTYSSAQLLLAFDAVATLAQADGTTKLAVSEVAPDGKTHPLALPPGLIPRVAIAETAMAVRFASQASLPAFWVVNQSGFDIDVPKAELREGMEILREYTDAAGRPVTTARLGDEIEVHLRVRSLRGTLRSVALVDLLPGGFELVLQPPAVEANANESQVAPPVSGRGREEQPASEPTNGEGGDGAAERDPGEATPPAAQDDPPPAQEGGEASGPPAYHPPFGTDKSTWQPEFADVREDRVVLYGAVGLAVREFIYRIKATTAGSFVLPPAYGEGMYDRTVRARSLSGARLTVESASKAPQPAKVPASAQTPPATARKP